MGAFEELVKGAKSGNRADVERLLEIYRPLIYQQSVVDGHRAADLRQHLYLEFIVALMKFEIFEK